MHSWKWGSALGSTGEKGTCLSDEDWGSEGLKLIELKLDLWSPNGVGEGVLKHLDLFQVLTCGNNLPLELSVLDWVGLGIGFLLVRDGCKNTSEFFVNFCTGSVGEKYVVFSLTLPWSKNPVSVRLLLDNGLQSCQKLSRHLAKVYALWYRSCHISHGWKASYRWVFHP